MFNSPPNRSQTDQLLVYHHLLLLCNNSIIHLRRLFTKNRLNLQFVWFKEGITRGGRYAKGTKHEAFGSRRDEGTRRARSTKSTKGLVAGRTSCASFVLRVLRVASWLRDPNTSPSETCVLQHASTGAGHTAPVTWGYAPNVASPAGPHRSSPVGKLGNYHCAARSVQRPAGAFGRLRIT
jgi:hypothetical protein